MATFFLSTLSTLLFVLSFNAASALFEDQAGKFDWMQKYVGRVDFLFWDQSHYVGKRILVGTEKNTIAAINVHNGSIAWRQMFEEGERGRINNLLHHGNALVSVSGNGKIVRSWVATSGFMQWEVVLSAQPTLRTAAMFMGSRKVESVVVLHDDLLFNLRIADGSEIWRMSLPKMKNIKNVYLNIIERDVYVVGIVPNSHAEIIVVNNEGNPKSSKTISAAWLSSDSNCIMTSYHLTCFDNSSLSLMLLPLNNGVTFIPTLLTDLGISDSITALEYAGGEIFSMKSGLLLARLHFGYTALLKVALDGSVSLMAPFDKLLCAHLTKHGDKSMLITLEMTGTELLKMSGFELSSGSLVPVRDLTHKISYSKSHGKPVKIDTLLFSKKDGRIGYKTMLRSEDYTLHLIHKAGRVAWRREEALAYIFAVEMVDLPLSESQAKFEDEFGSQQNDVLTMFMKRISSQIGQVKMLLQYILQRLQGHRHHQPSSLIDDDEDVESEEDDTEEDEEDLTRDDFNLNKIIVAITRPGKLFGIRSTNGRIIWCHYISKMAPFNNYGKPSLMLFVQRTTAHVGNHPQCLVLGKNKVNGEGVIYAFNPVTGNPVSDIPSSGKNLAYQVVQAAMYSEVDKNYLKGVLILDSNFVVHTYPASYQMTLRKCLPAVFFYSVSVEEGQMQGYRLISNRDKIMAEKTWTVNMQNKIQTITNVVTKRNSEVVHSLGRVLGDRSVLYKYLNPNLVVVTAEGEDTPSPSQKFPSNFLNIYLIDLITGNVVYHSNHRRVKGPVNVVHSENWVVYNFYNQKNRRNEMVVLEMYEGKEQSNSTAFSSLNPILAPLVTRQAYIFPAYISNMAATVTEKGITSKHVIVALKFGGLLSVPKAFLDPRRPVTPTQQHMEEGIIPYMPEIPINIEAIVNYNKSVYGISGIYTGSAGLESTSLILGYGLDLFYTRVNPSKMFDVLKDDFDYIFISSVLIGMIVVSVVSQKLAARKALNRAWR
ncbi:ER membrane protein complex subunit 1 [Octopus sinensis]|uniref:ER membrane protein complex subunit 1 n=1 Tax=Octopus sinensis TaxID=2607531 RepID=A0A6P7S7P3_9MOLL|nr:ER membrane protein complex subunit 1 [Octopus sinensis]